MRSRSKFLNVFSLAGLLLGSGACDSRKQYNSPPPPAPTDKSSSSIIPSDKLPQLVDGSGNIAEDVTPEQVISLASAWSKETIVWNKSAGGVVVGETDPQKWEAEIDRLSSVASFSLTAAPNFRSLNLTSRNGQIVADTVAGINVFSSYKGELPITRPDGSVTSIVLERDSLIDAGIIPAEAKGNARNPSSREFFRRFFLKFADDKFTATLPEAYDCFATDVCRQYQNNAQGFFVYAYDTPTGNNGRILIDLESYKIIQLSFSAPNAPSLDTLTQGSTLLDLERGVLFSLDDQQNLSDLGGLGRSLADFPETNFKATLSADVVDGEKSEWLPTPGSLVKLYAQGQLWFTSNDISATEKQPDANTGRLARISLNNRFLGGLILLSQGQVLNDFRLNLSIAGASFFASRGESDLFKESFASDTAVGHRLYLSKLVDVISQSPVLEIVSSTLENLESIERYPLYSASIVYRNKQTDSYFQLTFTSDPTNSQEASLDLSTFDKAAAPLLASTFEAFNTADRDFALNLRPAFGSIKPGSVVALRDVVDQYSDSSGLNRARLVTAEERDGKIVNLTKDVVLSIPTRTNTVSYDLKRIKAMSVSLDTGALSLVEEENQKKCKDLNLKASDRCFMVAAVTVITGKFDLSNDELGTAGIDFAIGDARKDVLSDFSGERKALIVSETTGLSSTKPRVVDIVDLESSVLRTGAAERAVENVDLHLRLVFSADDKLSAVAFFAPEILK